MGWRAGLPAWGNKGYSYSVRECRLLLDALTGSELMSHRRTTPTGDDTSLITQILQLDGSRLMDFNTDDLLKKNCTLATGSTGMRPSSTCSRRTARRG